MSLSCCLWQPSALIARSPVFPVVRTGHMLRIPPVRHHWASTHPLLSTRCTRGDGTVWWGRGYRLRSKEGALLLHCGSTIIPNCYTDRHWVWATHKYLPLAVEGIRGAVKVNLSFVCVGVGLKRIWQSTVIFKQKRFQRNTGAACWGQWAMSKWTKNLSPFILAFWLNNKWIHSPSWTTVYDANDLVGKKVADWHNGPSGSSTHLRRWRETRLYPIDLSLSLYAKTSQWRPGLLGLSVSKCHC